MQFEMNTQKCTYNIHFLRVISPPRCMKSALFWDVTQLRLVDEDGTDRLFRNIGT